MNREQPACSETTATCVGLGTILLVAVALCAMAVNKGTSSYAVPQQETHDVRVQMALAGKLPF